MNIPYSLQDLKNTHTFSVPESPRWLVSKGQDEKALRILCKLHHDPADIEDHFAHQELRLIRSQLKVDLTLITEHGQWQLFTMPTYRRREARMSAFSSSIITTLCCISLLVSQICKLLSWALLTTPGLPLQTLTAQQCLTGWGDVRPFVSRLSSYPMQTSSWTEH